MKQNIGSTDSFVRVMTGLAFYVNIFVFEPTIGAVGVIVLFALGTLCMVTAWTNHCPAYKATGICTCEANACECGDNQCCAK